MSLAFVRAENFSCCRYLLLVIACTQFSHSQIWHTNADSTVAYFLNGNVGIGTRSPARTLDVAGKIKANSGLFSENVGIATHSPINALDVRGSMVLGSSLAGVDTGPPDGLRVQGSVTIGTWSSPSALTLQNGTIASSGDNGESHFLWDVSKSALRSGFFEGTQIDEKNIGLFSAGVGVNALASGLSSIAIGRNVSATGDRSVALGENVNATASRSYAIGYGGGMLTNDIENSLIIGFNSSQPTLFVGPAAEADTSGSVGIGTTETGDFKLVVAGSVAAKEIVLQPDSWPDEVFRPGYALMPMTALRQFVYEQGHLPGVPGETQVLQEGVSSVAMHAALLRKVEELTLYLLELDEQFQAFEEAYQAIPNRSTYREE